MSRSNIFLLTVIVLSIELISAQERVKNEQFHKEYLIGPGNLNYNESVSYCKGYNMTLLKVRSQEEANWLRESRGKNIHTLQVCSWVGIKPVSCKYCNKQYDQSNLIQVPKGSDRIPKLLDDDTP